MQMRLALALEHSCSGCHSGVGGEGREKGNRPGSGLQMLVAPPWRRGQGNMVQVADPEEISTKAKQRAVRWGWGRLVALPRRK